MKKPWDLSKAVSFSDIHIHPWEAHSKVTQELFNTRLLDGIDTLNMILEYAIKKRIKYVLFGGDLFHKRNEVNIVAMNLVYEAIKDATQKGLEFYMITGNHDQAFNTKFDSLFFLRGIKGVHVFTEHCTVDLPGFGKVSFHPWDDNRVLWRNRYLEQIQAKGGGDIILSIMHYDFQNIEYRGNYVGSGTKSNVLYKDALSLCGHYHDFIPHRSLLFGGAPLHHNWGDSGKDRGFLVLKAESTLSKGFHKNHKGVISWRRIINEQSPRFVEIYDAKDVTQDNIEGNFVRIYKHMFNTQRWLDIYKKALEFSPLYMEPIDLPKLGTVEEVDIENFKIKNVEDIISSYVKTSGTPLDRKRLIEFGKEFVYNVKHA